MSVVLVMLAAISAIFGAVLVALACALSVLLDLLALIRRRRERPSPSATLGKALLVASAIASPFLAATIVAERNGWVDADRNGILDPMTNGSYDWVDLNGGDFLRLWGLLSAMLLVAWGIATRVPAHESPPVGARA